jgi:hypothetical protein
MVQKDARSDMEDKRYGNKKPSPPGTSSGEDSNLGPPKGRHRNTVAPRGVKKKTKNKAPSINKDSNPFENVVALHIGYPTIRGTNLYYQQYLDSN